MILVTGATGKVGTEVARQLKARGAPFRVLARTPQKARDLLGDDVEVAQGDLGDPASLDRALAGVDHLFLLVTSDRRQVEWETNAIEAARRAGVRHVVKLSVIGATRDSDIVLMRWHREAEEALEASGLDYTFLQPTFFIQNVLQNLPTIQSQGAFYNTTHGKAAFIDARDIAAVAVAALTEPGHAGKTYVLTGPEALSYDEVAQRLSEAAGRTITYVRVPPEAYGAALVEAGLPQWYADELVKLNSIIDNGWAEAVSGDVRLVTKREPTTVAQFARDHAAAFAAQPVTA
jgi:uncharacterized protein YbjT (DUF2867 family)